MIKRLSLLFLFVLIVSGCGKPPNVGMSPLVSDAYITKKEFGTYNNTPGQYYIKKETISYSSYMADLDYRLYVDVTDVDRDIEKIKISGAFELSVSIGSMTENYETWYVSIGNELDDLGKGSHTIYVAAVDDRENQSNQFSLEFVLN